MLTGGLTALDFSDGNPTWGWAGIVATISLGLYGDRVSAQVLEEPARPVPRPAPPLPTEVPGLGCTQYRGYPMCIFEDPMWKLPGSAVSGPRYVYTVDEGALSETTYATPALAAQGARETIDDWES